MSQSSKMDYSGRDDGIPERDGTMGYQKGRWDTREGRWIPERDDGIRIPEMDDGIPEMDYPERDDGIRIPERDDGVRIPEMDYLERDDGIPEGDDGYQKGRWIPERDDGIRIPERDYWVPKMDYWIPEYIHDPKHIKGSSTPCPSCPVIVFINTRSGGQLGSALLQSYRRVLNDNQVYDLHTEPPQEVLKRIYGSLERLKEDGDELAKKVSEKLRLIVAGGDGTANWMLRVVCDLKLPKPPPIATVPLGTGNNLPFSFGWGKKNPGTDNSAVETFLRQVMEAKEMKIDSWHITMRMKVAEDGLHEPIPPLELPNSLHAFNRVRSTESMNKEGERTYRGGFWNYFSVGMDAEVSYLFHSERKLHPEKFKSQILNQGAYLKLGFSTTLSQGSSRCIKEFTTIEVMKKPSDSWVCVDIPSGIKSVICLNLPSFSGGYNPWGIPNQRCDFTQVYVDDGLIEVVGFHNAIHGLFLLSHKGHGNRLAQAHKVRFTFSNHPTGDTYMRMDGEPWKQPLPKNGTVELEISHHRQVNMLARDKCVSKSKGSIDTSTPSIAIDDDESEEARKFGAAETFKLPEDIDIASLS